MSKQKSILIALAGVAMATASQGFAQLNYIPGDLLLNFRNTADATATDLEVNAGPVSALAAFNGSKVLVPAGVVSSVFGAPSTSAPIGFSASAYDGTSAYTLFVSRTEAAPGNPLNVGGYQSSEAASLTQDLVATAINNIGDGGNAGTSAGSGAATVTGATTGNSYQAQGEENNSMAGQTVIDFGSHENVGANKGGPIENIQQGTAAVYLALWEVPTGGATSASDTYLGSFTFRASGEVDYTSAGSIVQPVGVNLTIVNNSPASVTVLWTNAPGYILQQNNSLASAAGWIASSYPVVTSNGTNSVTIAPPVGNLFFRLIDP